MRLKQLRLAGFKSFADHTVISFPSNRVGVVGPNGCGKSNVIDAVRWVMGESSAKTLRGASMADVIFNGSTNRNPAESAEVELVFSEMNLPQYPQTEEIAIKRLLTRSGDSHYFINNIRCRRKDITDIFLGTGLGPRSYSIIEQGTISRFIEAKPDELRSFIEEAAGITKYKERRRETESRLEHTRENMARLDDVRMEVGKQLERLKRQARAAEKYQQLKEAESLLKAQLLAMRWRNFNAEVEKQRRALSEQEPAQETFQQRGAELAELHEQYRQQQSEAQHRFQEIQARYYTQQSELDRLTQSIEHQREKQEQLAWDLEQTTQSLTETRETLEADKEQLTLLSEDSADIQQQLETAEMEIESFSEAWREAETQWQEWQMQWESFNQQANQASQQFQSAQHRLAEVQQRLSLAQQRQQRLESERQQLDLTTLEAELYGINRACEEDEEHLAHLQETQSQQQTAIVEHRQKNQQLTAMLHEQQAQVQQLRGRLASLEALQEAALGKHNTDVVEWLQARGVSSQTPRLAQILTVEPGWERALETVLGINLEALCIEDLAHLTDKIDNLPRGQVCVMDNPPLPLLSQKGEKGELLLDKVQSNWQISALLAGVYTAENLSAAYRQRSRLAAHESIITPQGLWLGPNWLIINEEMDQRAGVFAREQDLQRLKNELLMRETQVEQCATALENGRDSLHHYEENRDQTAEQLRILQQRAAQLKAKQASQQTRREETQGRAARLRAESQELSAHIRSDQALAAEKEGQAAQTAQQLEDAQQQRESLSQQREARREAVEQTRRRLESAKEQRHALSGRSQALQADRLRLAQGINRLETQFEQLEDRRYDLEKNLHNQSTPEDWQARYDQQQNLLKSLATDLAQAQETAQQTESALRQCEERQRQVEAQINAQRALLEDTRLAYQANLVRQQNVEEQLTELPFKVETLLAELPAEANETAWQEGIADVEKRIQRLGAINLAALEEFAEQEQRKKYLDDQYTDLVNAMNLLERAIQEIDTESRERFSQTLEKVNQRFQSLFPHIFGGGEASLKLTSEDILTAGVLVMARPPGKRNTSIHLLSGGEKALTAVALVFAIFELNPAPFCMLDEVDAPLDDTNVGRFCKLVSKMAEQVQFIFISHNKITMEMAEQLIGVTMQEAGVSRPVAVDIDLALEMATV